VALLLLNIFQLVSHQRLTDSFRAHHWRCAHGQHERWQFTRSPCFSFSRSTAGNESQQGSRQNDLSLIGFRFRVLAGGDGFPQARSRLNPQADFGM
jgi:hypothetical protein